MAKIVYNSCHGGFSLSEVGIDRYLEIKGLKFDGEDSKSPYHHGARSTIGGKYWSDRDIPRNDPALAKVVEELGERASGRFAQLKIVEIPDGQLYRIDEYDGAESVETPESYDWSIA